MLFCIPPKIVPIPQIQTTSLFQLPMPVLNRPTKGPVALLKAATFEDGGKVNSRAPCGMPCAMFAHRPRGRGIRLKREAARPRLPRPRLRPAGPAGVPSGRGEMSRSLVRSNNQWSSVAPQHRARQLLHQTTRKSGWEILSFGEGYASRSAGEISRLSLRLRSGRAGLR